MDKVNIKECVKKDLHDKLNMNHLNLKDYDFRRNSFSVTWKKKKNVVKSIPDSIYFNELGGISYHYLDDNGKFHRLNGPAYINGDKEYFGIFGCLVHQVDYNVLSEMCYYSDLFGITYDEIRDMFFKNGSVVLNLWKNYLLEEVDGTIQDIMNPTKTDLEEFLGEDEYEMVWKDNGLHYNGYGIVSPSVLDIYGDIGVMDDENIPEEDQDFLEELMCYDCFNRPSFTNKKGDKFYIVDKKLHSVDGPAIVRANGECLYYLTGMRVTKELHEEHFESTVCAWSEFMPYYIKYGYLAD